MIDPSTWSNFNEIQTTHYFVDWLVDFATETLTGYIIHDMTVVQNTGCVVLDISPDITVEQVQDIPAGSAMNATNNDGNVPVYNNTYPVDWQVVCGDAACFKKILVIYPDQTQNTYVPGTEVSLRIDYTSAYNGTFNPNMTYAVNWVAAADTAGGKIPAVYSYCQTIGCRTLAPMQDTPAVRSSYGACLVANSSMDIYMSANKTGTFYSKYGFYKHCFYSQNPIPSYLFSFYAGDLGYLAVGTRTGVVADNAVLQSAFVDFSIANLEQILNVAENYI